MSFENTPMDTTGVRGSAVVNENPYGSTPNDGGELKADMHMVNGEPLSDAEYYSMPLEKYENTVQDLDKGFAEE